MLGVTRKLNGGTVGLAQRKIWLANWKAALGTAPLVMAAPPLVPEMPVSHPVFAKLITAIAAAFRRT